MLALAQNLESNTRPRPSYLYTHSAWESERERARDGGREKKVRTKQTEDGEKTQPREREKEVNRNAKFQVIFLLSMSRGMGMEFPPLSNVHFRQGLAPWARGAPLAQHYGRESQRHQQTVRVTNVGFPLSHVAFRMEAFIYLHRFLAGKSLHRSDDFWSLFL